MSSAMGVLHWTPEAFWGATMFEYTAAMKGYLTSKGVKFESMTRDEFLELKALDKKAR
jgi:hypothetical protein